MRKKLLICISFGVLFSLSAGATASLHKLSFLSKNTLSIFQSTITGTVSGPAGSLEGVTVTVVGTANSTITDEEGKFSIAVEIGNTLRFSSIGFKTQEIEVTGSSLDVELEADDTSLEEVVVVGYGTQRRSNLTGSVSTVDAEKTFETRPITDVGRALQGSVSGLSVSTPSGDLGGDPTIRLRGVSGSLQTEGGASPLILVDGVEVPSLSMINPNDIESMSVVKDASAAIYGSRAAWGVVLIKTKSGKRNTKTSINYSNNIALQKPTTTPTIAGGAEGAKAGLMALQRTNPSLTGYNRSEE